MLRMLEISDKLHYLISVNSLFLNISIFSVCNQFTSYINDILGTLDRVCMQSEKLIFADVQDIIMKLCSSMTDLMTRVKVFIVGRTEI